MSFDSVRESFGKFIQETIVFCWEAHIDASQSAQKSFKKKKCILMELRLSLMSTRPRKSRFVGSYNYFGPSQPTITRSIALFKSQEKRNFEQSTEYFFVHIEALWSVGKVKKNPNDTNANPLLHRRHTNAT